MSNDAYKAGDWVIYRKQKSSSSPGPRARNTVPSAKGETYHYIVEKYWVIDEVLEDGTLKMRTRRGKQNLVRCDDPRLYKPRLWQRWLFGNRFRAAERSAATA